MYIFIYNPNIEIFSGASNKSLGEEDYNLLENIISKYVFFKNNKVLYKIKSNDFTNLINDLHKNIKFLLKQRKPTEHSTNSVLSRGDLFHDIEIFGNIYRFYKGGIDNRIMLLILFEKVIEEVIKLKQDYIIVFRGENRHMFKRSKNLLKNNG